MVISSEKSSPPFMKLTPPWNSSPASPAARCHGSPRTATVSAAKFPWYARLWIVNTVGERYSARSVQ